MSQIGLLLQGRSAGEVAGSRFGVAQVMQVAGVSDLHFGPMFFYRFILWRLWRDTPTTARAMRG